MDNIEVRDYILSLPNVEETMPFKEDDIVVYKVGGKWIATYIFSRPEFLAVKCNPDRAILLRDEFPAITPAWHFNQKHWNDLRFNDLPDDVVKREIRHSYLTVIKTTVTPKALRLHLLEEAQKANIEDAPALE